MLCDFIHVFKSLKEMFMKNKIMLLSDYVVHTEKLVSNIVDQYGSKICSSFKKKNT